MDLLELDSTHVKQHPWETARLQSIVRILNKTKVINKKMKVLDVGCGDGFIARSISEELELDVTAIDIHLTKQQAAALSSSTEGANFYNTYDEIAGLKYDFILLLDVIEHLYKDGHFLSKIVTKYLAPGGYLLITAPAFKFLFSSHDLFLKHYRRYSHSDLMELVSNTNLNKLVSGYMYFSLLLPRFIHLCLDKIISPKFISNKGVGHWNYDRKITKLIEVALRYENAVLLAMNFYKIRIPGLTVWTLCQKQPL